MIRRKNSDVIALNYYACIHDKRIPTGIVLILNIMLIIFNVLLLENRILHNYIDYLCLRVVSDCWLYI